MKLKKNDLHKAATTNTVMGVKEWVSVGFLSIIWGGSFFFIEVAVTELTPLTIVLSRVGLAALFLFGFVYLTGRKLPRSIKIWGGFLVMGALNNLIPFSLIVWGQTHIQSSLASILNATTPIFSVILAHLLTRDELLTVNRGVGILTGWIGVTVLIGIDSSLNMNVHFFGQIAVLGAAFSYACAAIFGRRFHGIDPIIVATGMLIGSTVMMIPVVFVFETPWNLTPSTITWFALIGLSLISTSLAYIIYFRILATAGATNLLLVTFLIPVSAIFLGVMVLGEQLYWDDIGGMGLILVGLLVIDGRILKFPGKEIFLNPGKHRHLKN